MHKTFRAWPKIARLNLDILVTEKIDGTNAQLLFVSGGALLSKSSMEVRKEIEQYGIVTPNLDGWILAGSRKRWLTPDQDNFGFRQWVEERAQSLWDHLGKPFEVARHYGEFFGHGIQRGYGLPQGDRRLALFNHELDVTSVPGVETVPVLYKGGFSQIQIRKVLNGLAAQGSVIVPGYRNPEGIVVYHTHARQRFKVTIEGDYDRAVA